MGLGGGKSGKTAPMADKQTVLHALRVQTSALGSPLPIGWGQNRVSGKLLDYQDFKAIPHTTTQHVGKGGGGQDVSNTTYTYKAAIDIALCGNEIYGLKNVWDTTGKLTLLSTSQTYTIPPGGGTYTPTVPSSGKFYIDDGVGYDSPYDFYASDYGSDGATRFMGSMRSALARKIGIPDPGEYAVDQNTGTYTFNASDAGKQAVINYTYSVPNSTGDTSAPATQLALTVMTGTRPQSPWSYMSSAHSARALNYPGIAHVASSGWDLGGSGTLQNYSYEVAFKTQFGAGIVDANPSDVVKDIITSPYYGTTFPIANLGDLTSYSSYCVANGLFLSPVVESQTACADFLLQLAKLTNTGIVWSEGKLKFIPFGDSTAVANGVTYTPNTTPYYDLTDADFIAGTGEEPITLEIVPPEEQYNVCKLEILNRANSYNPLPIEDKDDASIQVNGLREADVITAHEICDQNIAKKVAMLINRRTAYITRKFKFKLGLKYILLEPMDLVTVTDSHLGLNKYPVRILEINEDENGLLDIVAEEFPWGTATPTLYSVQSASGTAPQSEADPGLVNTPVVFEASNRLARYSGNELWMAVSGQSANWGGCTIWASSDNATYKVIGRVYGSARMGTLSSTFANGSDPDTTNICAVDLSMSNGTLSSGTSADADNFNTLCYVGGELIAYQTATLTSANHYNLGTKIRRGVFNTPISSHAAGSQFARLDDSIFVYQYDPTWANKTIYLKFTSFNVYGAQEYSLAEVSPYSFTIPGVNGGAIDLTTGVLVAQQNSSAVSVDNANFEASSALPPPGWTVGSSTTCTVSYETASPQSGTRSAKLVTTGQGAGIFTVKKFRAVPGDKFKLVGYMKTAGGGVQAGIQVKCWDGSGNFLANIAQSSTTSTSWTFGSNTGTCPANTVNVTVSCEQINTTNGTIYFDNISCAKVLSGVDEVVYGDGTSLESLKPGEGGATNGATIGTNLRIGSGTIVKANALLNNLIDPSVWVIGSNGNQGAFTCNGTVSENAIILGSSPRGTSEALWQCGVDSASDADGGWNLTWSDGYDPTKTYRYCVWAKQTNTNGSLYMGCSSYSTNNLDGSANGNPYFWYGDLPQNNKWYLIVGVLHGSGYGTTDTGVSGVYDPATGARVLAGIEYKSIPGATSQVHRAYLYYSTDLSNYAWFCRPRVDLVDGNEPSIIELIGTATVGAQVGTNLMNGGTVLGAADIITSQGTAYDVQYGAGKAVKEFGAEATTGKDLSVLSGRTADKLSYTAGGTVDYYRPAEPGADSTTGKSMTVLTNRTLNNIADDPGGTYRRPLYVGSDGKYHVSSGLTPQGSIQPQAISASGAINGTWDGYSPYLAFTFTNGYAYSPDGQVWTVSATGANYTTWNGVTVGFLSHYNGNIVLRTSDGAVILQQYSGYASTTTIKDAFADGYIAINWGINATTPNSGGTGGGGGGGTGCFSGNTHVNTPEGSESFADMEARVGNGGEVIIRNKFGDLTATLIVHDEADWDMLDMGDGELVTLNHMMWHSRKKRGVAAEEYFAGCPQVKYHGKVYNLSVHGTRSWHHWYVLRNGAIASNQKVITY